MRGSNLPDPSCNLERNTSILYSSPVLLHSSQQHMASETVYLNEHLSLEPSQLLNEIQVSWAQKLSFFSWLYPQWLKVVDGFITTCLITEWEPSWTGQASNRQSWQGGMNRRYTVWQEYARQAQGTRLASYTGLQKVFSQAQDQMPFW